MNHPFHDNLDDEELSAAFEVEAPNPSSVHVEQLRQEIAARTEPHEAPAVPRSPSLRFRLPISFAALATVLLIALMATRPFVEDAAASLQVTLKATREALWIHGSTTIERADQSTIVAESWCSPAERIVAFRSLKLMHFIDYEKAFQWSYSEEHGNIFQWQADPASEGFGREFVQALLNDEGLDSSLPFHDVSDVTKIAIDVGGKSASQYSFHVQMKSNPNVHWKTTIRTDPATGRIVHWEDLHGNGTHVTIEFTYPRTGPHDIFELGAPSTSTVIMIQTPGSDLFGPQL